MIVRELVARLGLDFDETAFNKGEKALSSVKSVAQGLAGIFVAGGIAAGLKNIVTGAAAAADAADEAASSFGITAQALQELQHAANLSGVKQEDLRTSLSQLARNAHAAGAGSKEASQAFAALGVDVRLNGQLRSVDDLLMSVADRMASIENPTERAALAARLFGRSGGQLIPMLLGGSDGIGKLRGEVSELGAAFSDDFIANAVEFNDTLDRIGLVVAGVRNAIAAKLLPILTPLLKGFVAFSKLAREAIKNSKILEVTFVALGAAAGIAAAVMGVKLLSAVGSLGVAVLKLAAGFVTAGNAALFAQLKMALIGLAIVGLIALVALLAEDLYVFFTGGESLIGRLIAKFKAWVAEFIDPANVDPDEHPMLTFLRSVMDMIVRATRAVNDFFESFEKPFKSPAMQAMLDTLKALGPGGAAIDNALSFYKDKAAALFAPSVASPTPQAIASSNSTAVSAPVFNMEVQVNGAPGQSDTAIAEKVTESVRNFVTREFSDASAALTPAMAR